MIDSSKTFLKNGDDEYSYGCLCDFLSAADKYFPQIKTASLQDYLFNFILALARGRDVVLLDSDLSESEIAALGIGEAGKPEPLDSNAEFARAEDVVSAVRKSPSKITVFTSGTTGIPKKVSHTVGTLSRAVRESPEYANHIWGFAYNPTHMAGLQVLFQALFNGNKIVNLFGLKKEDILSEIGENNVSHISATPTFYRLLLPIQTPLASVRRITCGGEKSDDKLYAKLLEAFPNAKINNIYASTEFGTLLASSGEFFRIRESDSDKIKIENGELVVHKSMLGFSDSLKLDGDWYHTGDIVVFQNPEKTLFKFLARVINILNVGGYKVNIEEVEDTLREMPQISDVVVYGRKNSVLGNILCADIKLLPDAELSVVETKSFLEKKLQYYKIPRKINFVDSIEFTKSGKIKR